MKKVLKSLALIIIITLLATSFAACGKTTYVTIDENSVIIVASNEIMEITSETTLLDYMKALEDKEELTYKTTESTYGAFITEINDKTAGISQSWMIYTDDSENSNAEYGTLPYNETVYNSASLGVSSLIIKEGKTYIFVLQTFN
jgi:hypothetical protein